MESVALSEAKGQKGWWPGITDDELVRANKPMVMAIAKGIKRKGSFTSADLIQEGFQGLLEAARSYDPSLNVRFDTFAVRRIAGHMMDSLRQLGSTVRIPRSQIEKGNGILTLTGNPDILTFASDDAAAQRKPSKTDADLVRRCVDSLGPRKSQMLRQYFGIELTEPKTMREIGDSLGISESRVSQMFRKVLIEFSQRYHYRAFRELPKPTHLAAIDSIRRHNRKDQQL